MTSDNPHDHYDDDPRHTKDNGPKKLNFSNTTTLIAVLRMLKDKYINVSVFLQSGTGLTGKIVFVGEDVFGISNGNAPIPTIVNVDAVMSITPK